MTGVATFEHAGRTYRITNFMTWDEVEQAETFFTPGQENVVDLIRAAATVEEKLKVAGEIRKCSTAQRAFVKKMLVQRVGLSEDELKKMSFIDALLIYNKYFNASNDISPFLELPSGPASSSDST